MNSLALLAPIFLAFEGWQLAMCERYVGIKQIARGGDPREMGPAEWVSFLWTAAIAVYAAWVLLLVLNHDVRLYAVCLVATTALGYPIRRSCGLKWILVVLTFEGAVRIGLLFALSFIAWRHL